MRRPYFVLTSIIEKIMSENKDTFCSFIDMQNAFDWVNRDMLFYRLLDYNIDGNIYNCIKALYRHPSACIKINGYISEWFDISSGVWQGDSLSPAALFGLYINDLINEVEKLNLEVKVEEELVSILAFADDIVIIGNTEKELQQIIKCVVTWCKNWRLKVNTEKTNIVHFRRKQKQ